MCNLCSILISQEVVMWMSKNLEDSLVIPLWLHDALALSLLLLFSYKHFSCDPYLKQKYYCIVSDFIFPIDICLLSEVGNGYWKSIFLIKQKNYDHYRGLFNQLLDVPMDILSYLSCQSCFYSRKVTRHLSLKQINCTSYSNEKQLINALLQQRKYNIKIHI